VGQNKNEPTAKHIEEVTIAIDAIAAGGGLEVYVEILSKPGRRTKKPLASAPGSEALNPENPANAEAKDEGSAATALPAGPAE
jgi:hypothetical protein